jgi:hypothetical protein
MEGIVFAVNTEIIFYRETLKQRRYLHRNLDSQPTSRLRQPHVFANLTSPSISLLESWLIPQLSQPHPSISPPLDYLQVTPSLIPPQCLYIGQPTISTSQLSSPRYALHCQRCLLARPLHHLTLSIKFSSPLCPQFLASSG